MPGPVDSGHPRTGAPRLIPGAAPRPLQRIVLPSASTGAPTHPRHPATHQQLAAQQPSQSSPATPHVYAQRVSAAAPVFVAAKEALGGTLPTTSTCADFLAKTLQAQLPSIPTRSAASKATSNRIYITVDIIKSLHAAAAFIAAETDKTSDEKLRSIQASIQSLSNAQAATAAAVADIAANTRKTQEAVKTAAAEAKNAPPPPPEEGADEGWTVVDRRNKNRRTGYLPLSQRLPSTDVIFSALDKKKPPFKGATPADVLTKTPKGVSIIHIVRSARPLPSGDWIITFGTAKWARLVSRYKDSWLDQLHPGFFIKDGEFEVAVDLVPLTFNLEEYSHYKDLVQNNPVVKDSTLIDWIGGARGLEEA
ncbi:unnamed protein product, partial [Tilletia laevis]